MLSGKCSRHGCNSTNTERRKLLPQYAAYRAWATAAGAGEEAGAGEVLKLTKGLAPAHTPTTRPLPSQITYKFKMTA
jgi:hypothetical protein